jgi:death-on-curing protein
LRVDDLLESAAGVVGKFAVRDWDCFVGGGASACGEEAYPRFAGKAAALMHSLARTHALVDGHKRLARRRR